MSFNANASGTRGFRFSSHNNPDENIFTAADIISAVSSVSGPNLKGIGEGVADYTLPSIDDTTRSAINSFARIGFLSALVTAVSRLATIRFGSQGSIGISAHRSKLLGENIEFARYSFSPGIQPGIEFVQATFPALDETGLNHYGTLRVLAQILNKYYDFIDDEKDKPVLLIEIFN